MGKPLIDKVAAAEYLGVSVKWIDRKVSEREIPFLKLGGLVRFDQDQLDAYRAMATQQPKQRAG